MIYINVILAFSRQVQPISTASPKARITTARRLIYLTALCYTQATANDAKSNTLSKAKKDARAIPNLVFAVEAWERQLVLAGRAAKVRGLGTGAMLAHK